MANRPVFYPTDSKFTLVEEKDITFTWFPGLSASQKQKSIRSLHESVKDRLKIDKILEISSKSELHLGIQLSAFNLMGKAPNGEKTPIEVIFQGSKVFENGGPYTDIYSRTSREAKKDLRIRNSGRLKTFRFGDTDWPLIPRTAFYDWLYINALKSNRNLAEEVMAFEVFSDIEFNPKKSLNCQASAAALFVALSKLELLDEALKNMDSFIKTAYPSVKQEKNKPNLEQLKLDI